MKPLDITNHIDYTSTGVDGRSAPLPTGHGVVRQKYGNYSGRVVNPWGKRPYYIKPKRSEDIFPHTKAKDSYLTPIKFHHYELYRHPSKKEARLVKLRKNRGDNRQRIYKHFWLFHCRCGNFCVVEKSAFMRKTKGVKSCGCKKKETSTLLAKTEKFRANQNGKYGFKKGNPYGGSNKGKESPNSGPHGMIAMYTGNAHRHEGRVYVTEQEAREIWANVITLESVIEKRRNGKTN